MIATALVCAEQISPTEAENDDFRIHSSKEVYHCEPILSELGCLVNIDFGIDVKKIKDKDLDVELAFSHDKVKIKEFSGLDIKIKDDKLKIKFDKKEDYPFFVQIWALYDAKFNINIFDESILLLSLDPFVNVTINSSYPSYWLLNGTNNQSNINQYQQKIENSAGLSDNNTATNYTTRKSTILNKTLDYTDGTFEGTEYLAFNREIIAVDYNISNINLIENAYACVVGGKQEVTVYVNLTFNTTFTNVNVPLPQTTTPTTYTCVQMPLSYLKNGTNRIGFGCSAGCSNPKDRFYFATDSTSPNGNSYYWNLATWTQHTTHDEGIKIFFIETNFSKGMALQPYFNYTFNLTNNTYWLNIRTNMTTSQNISVYAYINNTHINTTSFITKTVTSSNFFVNIMPLLYNGYNEAFRVFTTSQPLAISDIYLYEQTEVDITPPNISNCTFNTTNISCGEHLRVMCKVTDEYYVDDVWFFGQHGNGTYQQMDAFQLNGSDYYYVDLTSYNFCTSEPITSTFIKANATDISGNVGEYYPNINFTYTCICPADFRCYYSSEPYLKTKIPFTYRDRFEWLCFVDRDDLECVSEVSKDGALLQTKPNPVYIDGIGMIDSYSLSGSENHYFRAWFDKENLLPLETFNFTVKCSTSTGSILQYSAEITPTYKDLEVITYRGVWLKKNMAFVILIIGIIVFALVMWRISRR